MQAYNNINPGLNCICSSTQCKHTRHLNCLSSLYASTNHSPHWYTESIHRLHLQQLPRKVQTGSIFTGQSFMTLMPSVACGLLFFWCLFFLVDRCFANLPLSSGTCGGLFPSFLLSICCLCCSFLLSLFSSFSAFFCNLSFSLCSLASISSFFGHSFSSRRARDCAFVRTRVLLTVLFLDLFSPKLSKH